MCSLELELLGVPMRDALFIGEILASVTHEMQNVLAIIKESGALAEDILHINGPLPMKHGDKLTVALGNIGQQTGRGRNLMFMLNGFAHAAEDFPEVSDLGRCTRQICTLAERKLMLAECRLETALPEKPVRVRGNALLLMQAIYAALQSMLAVTVRSGALHVSVEPLAANGNESARLIVRSDNTTGQPDTASSAALVTELGGTLQHIPGAISLHFPCATEGA
jgi:Signal transduction histidine kinase regulating C4-dicarboxylate transport system